MCGVVGAVLDNPSDEDIETLKRVLLETEIRGKHASGIAWFDGNGLKSVVLPITISKFLENFDLHGLLFDNKIRMIGHIRYSTSDIEYNQPIGDGTSFIAHNGVVSQADPSTWEETYGYKCETRNDSELLWNAIKNHEEYMHKFPGVSASYVFIDDKGEISHGRNSLRPQWIGFVDSGYIIGSTRNILIRAGITKVHKVVPDDGDELIHRNMDESYKRIQNILQ